MEASNEFPCRKQADLQADIIWPNCAVMCYNILSAALVNITYISFAFTPLHIISWLTQASTSRNAASITSYYSI